MLLYPFILLPFYLFTLLLFQVFFYIFQYSVERGGGLVTVVFL